MSTQVRHGAPTAILVKGIRPAKVVETTASVPRDAEDWVREAKALCRQQPRSARPRVTHRPPGASRGKVT
jgi:hypothetical protein